MRKDQKAEINKLVTDLFGINVNFFSRKNKVVGYCNPKEDTKNIWICMTDSSPVDTIAHEIAHIRQFLKKGNTFCYESSKPKTALEHEFCKEHALMLIELTEELKPVKKKINDLFNPW